MGFEDVTRAVFHTAWNLPPTKLGRFLVATVLPGEYARDIRQRHEQAQRLSDENTLRVLASVALWQRNSERPTCRREAESVLRAFCQQSTAKLDKALDPHAAAVAAVLVRGNAEPVESVPGPAGASRAPAAPAAADEVGALRQTLTRTHHRPRSQISVLIGPTVPRSGNWPADPSAVRPGH
jgi:hypothetical protein